MCRREGGYKADDVIYYGAPELPYQQLAAILASRIARGERRYRPKAKSKLSERMMLAVSC